MDGGHGDTERGIIPKAFAHIFDAIQVSLNCANGAPSRQQRASHGLHAAGYCPSDGFCQHSMNYGSASIICHSALTRGMSNADQCLHVDIRESPVPGAC